MRKGDLLFAAYFIAIGYLAAQYGPELRQLAADTAQDAIERTTLRVLDTADRRRAEQRIELAAAGVGTAEAVKTMTGAR